VDASTLISPAAVAMVEVALKVRPDQLDGPTPCPDWTVRQLVSHLMYWAPVLERAGRKAPVEPLPDAERDLAVGDWQERLGAQAQALAAAWREPAAWTGTSRMTGPESPAQLFGGMTLCELVLHGWDLARATDQELACDEATATGLYRLMEPMAAHGRSMGAFGPRVVLADSAPPLPRVLAMSGRDPDWIR
jgi:uncharacterized protein (TIGR03086 family)